MATKPTESVVNKIRFWSFPLSLHLVVFFYILDFDNSNAFILGSWTGKSPPQSTPLLSEVVLTECE